MLPTQASLAKQEQDPLPDTARILRPELNISPVVLNRLRQASTKKMRRSLVAPKPRDNSSDTQVYSQFKNEK